MGDEPVEAAVEATAASAGEEVLAEMGDPEAWDIERAVLTAGFVRMFGSFVSNEVRPLLRGVAEGGGEPQLLINGLAELLRSTADSIEFPLDHPRAGSPGV